MGLFQECSIGQLVQSRVFLLIFSLLVFVAVYETYRNKNGNFAAPFLSGSSSSDSEDILRLGYRTCGWYPQRITGHEHYLERKLTSLTCAEVFSRWLDINSQKAIPGPESIPESLYTQYTLNRTIKVGNWYFNEMAQGRKKRNVGKRIRRDLVKIWTKKMVDDIRKQLDTGNWHLGPGYGSDALPHSMNVSKPKGRGLVIGSLTPWVEGAALYFGADSVLTATYNELNSQDPRISAIYPKDMAQNYSKFVDSFDWAASFSSIEHSGLGRYGDVLDPSGDILEMQKVRCWLKPGGLFYFAVPAGAVDYIIWNAHRIYGRHRLPYMFAGFDVVTVVEHNVDHKKQGGNQITIEKAVNTNVNNPQDATQQHLFVLKKVPMSQC